LQHLEHDLHSVSIEFEVISNGQTTLELNFAVIKDCGRFQERLLKSCTCIDSATAGVTGAVGFVVTNASTCCYQGLLTLVLLSLLLLVVTAGATAGVAAVTAVGATGFS
jgi:hypothetical protein